MTLPQKEIYVGYIERISTKLFKQIKDVENSFVVLDDVVIGSKHKIPLWLFGFLY
jgi:hypothetical protein